MIRGVPKLNRGGTPLALTPKFYCLNDELDVSGDIDPSS